MVVAGVSSGTWVVVVAGVGLKTLLQGVTFLVEAFAQLPFLQLLSGMRKMPDWSI